MITKNEVQHIAKLARLGLSEKEVEKYQKEFSKILDYIDKLKEVDVSGANKTTDSSCNIIRKDEALKFNKKLVDGYIKVPSILK